METYNKYLSARETLNNLISKYGGDIIRECYAPLFEKNPEVLKVSWCNQFLVDSDNSGFQTDNFCFLVKEEDVEFKNCSDQYFRWVFDNSNPKEDGYVWLEMMNSRIEKHCPQFLEGLKACRKPSDEIFENTFGWNRIYLNRDGTFEIDEEYDGYYRA